MRETVWLVGMMGAGKSSVGRALAARLGVPFVDADARVEEEAGRPIPEIFAAEGEVGFRRREREVIEALAGARAVVALGGGAVGQPGIPERLAASGRVVWLRARAETLRRRLGAAAGRPLLAGLDEAGREARLRGLLAEREPHYARASLVVDTDALSVEEVARRVADGLEEAA